MGSITCWALNGGRRREPEQHHGDVIGERPAAEVPEQRIEIEGLRIPMLGDVVEQVLLLPALVRLVGWRCSRSHRCTAQSLTLPQSDGGLLPGRGSEERNDT